MSNGKQTMDSSTAGTSTSYQAQTLVNATNDNSEQYHDASEYKQTDAPTSSTVEEKISDSATSSDTEDDWQSTETLQLIAGSATATPVAPEPEKVRRTAKRRTEIPPKPAHGLAVWAILKNSIGKDLSRIAMPVNFNEPLSMIQRLCEDFEYSSLLDRAVDLSSTEQMAYVAAFAVTAWTNSKARTTKPFNPLLGETYECDRNEDFGWRIFAEQVSHHPPVCALNAQGKRWVVHEDFGYHSKFRGANMKLFCDPGTTHLTFRDSKGKTIHYSWDKSSIKTTIHGIVIGPLWLDHYGQMTITNHSSGDKCHLKFYGYSYWSKSHTPRQVSAAICDKLGQVHWRLEGNWDEHLDIMEVLGATKDKDGKEVEQIGSSKRLWTVTEPLPECERMYNFSKLAIELNEMEKSIAPTDSRYRPDQRLMEQGHWDDANAEKCRLEEKQRAVAKHRKETNEEHRALWFRKGRDQTTGVTMWRLSTDYWHSKQIQDWERCPEIF